MIDSTFSHLLRGVEKVIDALIRVVMIFHMVLLDELLLVFFALSICG